MIQINNFIVGQIYHNIKNNKIKNFQNTLKQKLTNKTKDKKIKN